MENFPLASINEAIDSPLMTTGINEKIIEEKFAPKIVGDIILFDSPVSCQVFSVVGQKIIQEKNILSIVRGITCHF